MLDEYPSDSDYRVIVEEKFGRDKMQQFLQQNKNFLIHTDTTEDVADLSRRLFFGYEDTEALKRGVLRKGNEQKSSAYLIKSDASNEELEKDLDRACDNEIVFNKNKSLTIERTKQLDTGFEVELSYVHQRTIQRNLLNKNDKRTTLRVEETGEEDVRKVTQDYRKYDEFNAMKDFFDGWRRERLAQDKKPIYPEGINLKRLDVESRVELFTRLFTYHPGDWRFDEAIEIGLEQSEQPDEMFAEAEEDTEDLEEELDENLRGITNAVLRGENLRSNEFVQKCINSRYYFKSARLRFSSNEYAKEVDVGVEFKEKPRETFDITIESEYKKTEDGRKDGDFSPDFRDETRDLFRDVVIEIFGELADLPNLIATKDNSTNLTELTGVGNGTAENLENAGYDTIEDVIKAERDDLLKVKGIGEEIADSILGD